MAKKNSKKIKKLPAYLVTLFGAILLAVLINVKLDNSLAIASNIILFLIFIIILIYIYFSEKS